MLKRRIQETSGPNVVGKQEVRKGRFGKGGVAKAGFKRGGKD